MDSIKKMKRQPTGRGKIFVNHMLDKGFAHRIYKECLNLNNKSINTPIKKWAKDVNGHFSREDT